MPNPEQTPEIVRDIMRSEAMAVSNSSGVAGIHEHLATTAADDSASKAEFLSNHEQVDTNFEHQLNLLIARGYVIKGVPETLTARDELQELLNRIGLDVDLLDIEADSLLPKEIKTIILKAKENKDKENGK